MKQNGCLSFESRICNSAGIIKLVLLLAANKIKTRKLPENKEYVIKENMWFKIQNPDQISSLPEKEVN